MRTVRIVNFCSFAITTVLLLRTGVFAGRILTRKNEDLSRAKRACNLLQESFPQLVSYPDTEQYVDDIYHWAVSSEQNATCSIVPTSADDISATLKIIGRSDIRAPFAVKSGGHAYNLGQSSTPGVQISMSRFANVSYDAARGTVTLGVGQTWGEVYEQLEPLGVMVAGGRINGIGVGGYSLGGGYSWKSNQYGLLIDTIESYELVLPTGESVHVTNASEPDLFFALKGGLNNFGIVTQITVEAHAQTLVYGGVVVYSESSIDSVTVAINNFSQNNTDPKVQALPVYASVNNLFIVQLLLFYDAPTPPSGIYDEFLSIPAELSDVKTRSFIDLQSVFGDGDLGIGPFGIAQHTVPIVQYTIPILDEMVAQTKSFGARLTEQNNGSTITVVVAPEPFFNAFSHSRGGAYPHPPSRQVTPVSAYIAYQEDPNVPLAERIDRHDRFADEIKAFTYNIQAKAVEEGESRWDDILYPNYALPGTPLELLYGSNVQRLRELAAKYDPDRVMTLTGGVHFQQ